MPQQDQSDSRANGIVSGRASRIVIGWIKLSNCAARIMYMKTSERTKARMKLSRVSSSVLAWPLSGSRSRGGSSSAFRTSRTTASTASPSRDARRGCARRSTIRWRFEPLDLGRAPAFLAQRAKLPSWTRPAVGERDRQVGDRLARRSAAGLGAEPDVVLLVALLVVRDRLAADQDRQACRRSTRPGRPGRPAALAVDDHLQLGLAERERGVDVDQPLRPCCRRSIRRSEYSASFSRSGPPG